MSAVAQLDERMDPACIWAQSFVAATPLNGVSEGVAQKRGGFGCVGAFLYLLHHGAITLVVGFRKPVQYSKKTLSRCTGLAHITP
jgi:hypothetical protein